MKTEKITIEEAKELLNHDSFEHVYVDFDNNIFTVSAEYNAAEDEINTHVDFIGQLQKYSKKEIRQFLYSIIIIIENQRLLKILGKRQV